MTARLPRIHLIVSMRSLAAIIALKKAFAGLVFHRVMLLINAAPSGRLGGIIALERGYNDVRVWVLGAYCSARDNGNS